MSTARSDRCRDLLLRVSRYVDGDLDGAERRALAAHIRRCPCCKSLAQGLNHTVVLCRDASTTRLPPPMRARAKARVAALLLSEGRPR